ncbi:hypothetical protein ACU6QF_00215, partial [Aeromonas veronii]|uniref:hypothetical protein n=1 Tax=Aeromonas veronii TaxID=654 RepID=UPI00406BFAAC
MQMCVKKPLLLLVRKRLDSNDYRVSAEAIPDQACTVFRPFRRSTGEYDATVTCLPCPNNYLVYCRLIDPRRFVHGVNNQGCCLRG